MLPPVVVVMMENREDTQLTSSNAPYLTSLKTTGRYFSMYTSVVHPSFPNYLAIASGSTQGNTGVERSRKRSPARTCGAN